ncbi:MAG TPA: glycosyl hydrolase, partial [Segetibacter sp.]|nr:glycosyl hydrolase [Segetibacter sp.]
VLKKLEKLVFEGATIIGRKPSRTNSLKNYPQCDDEVKSIADKIWGKCDGKTILSNKYGKGTIYWGESVKEVLDELNIPPDVEVKGINNSDKHIDYIHRKTESQDVYFLSNSAPHEEKITCIFRVDQNKIPELWDAETGLIQRKVEYSKVTNGIKINFAMDPLGSRFVVFRNSSTGKNDAGLSYNLQYGFNHTKKLTGGNKTIDISYNWNVKFDPAMGGPASYEMDSLVSWSNINNAGVKYYSGSATYERNFSVGKEALAKGTKVFVVFDEIKEMVRVSVNGNDCGIVWTPPYKANITRYLKEGQNRITVQVINTWNNRIVGDLKIPSKKYSNTNIKSKFKANGPLLKSGLIGKAQIYFSNSQL